MNFVNGDVSQEIAEYLLQGWRISEVVSDYRAVLLVNNKTSEQKYVYFDDSNKDGLDIAAPRSSSCNDNVCGQEHAAIDPVVLRFEGSNSTAAVQGDSEYLSTYIEPERDNVMKSTISSHTSLTYASKTSGMQSMQPAASGRQNFMPTRPSFNPISKPTRSLIVEKGSIISNKNSPLVSTHNRFLSGNNGKPRKNSLPKNHVPTNTAQLVPHPVVRPNNRHSLDVPGPESVKEGPVVSEALTTARDHRIDQLDQERARGPREDEDGEKGSVVVRYNEASVHTADIDYDDVDDDVDEAVASTKNQVEDNSAIESSDNSEEDKNSHSGAEINSASSGSTNRQKSVTFHSTKRSLYRRMRLAAQELEGEIGDYCRAANVIKSCAEALAALKSL